MTSEFVSSHYALTIDPLHIGAGGYRLGRVDNTILREPGTNLPKIPGSSLSGVCRSHAHYGLAEADKADADACLAPGKSKNNCGACRICRVFGFANGEAKKSQIGLVKFFDGRLVAFPVSTMTGPRWVTCPSILQEIGVSLPKEPGREALLAIDPPQSKKLNLGWLYLPVEGVDKTVLEAFPHKELEPLKSMLDRLVVAPDWLFPEIVNANLEVRTSVAIDFETGAADEGKLFTYEAIPRAALLRFDICYDGHRAGRPGALPLDEVKGTVRSGLRLFESLGIGGMNTRGFGRLKVLNLDA